MRFRSGPLLSDKGGGNPRLGSRGLRTQIIGADGVPVGADFAVNSTELDFPHATPAVTTLANGSVLVVWHSGAAGDGDWGWLPGRFLGADGRPVAGGPVINGRMMNNQSSPALQRLKGGRVVINWSSDEGRGAGAQTPGGSDADRGQRRHVDTGWVGWAGCHHGFGGQRRDARHGR